MADVPVGLPDIVAEIIRAIKSASTFISQIPHGRVEVKWQDGHPVIMEITMQAKPAQRN